TIERARPPAAVKARVQLLDLRLDSVPNFQSSLQPPALCQPRLFARLVRIREKNLARYGEDFLILESIEQRLKRTALDTHVAVQQHDDIVLGFAKSRVRSAAESEVGRERKDLHRREVFPHKFSAFIRRSVIDDDDLVLR